MPSRTNTILNGTDLGVYTGASPSLIGASTTCSLQLTRDTRDVSNKDSGGWKAVKTGQKSWSISTEGLYNPSGTNGYIALYNAWTAGTELTLTLKSAGNPTGDYYWSGSAVITSLQMNAPNEGNATFSVTFQGTGALTMTDPLAA